MEAAGAQEHHWQFLLQYELEQIKILLILRWLLVKIYFPEIIIYEWQIIWY